MFAKSVSICCVPGAQEGQALALGLRNRESFAEVAKRRMSRSLVKEVDQVELDTEC